MKTALGPASLAVLVLAGQPGWAQTAPPALATGQETRLNLSATGSVQAAPDQLVAALVAQDTSASAADAQRRVNTLIARGMQAAGLVPSVDARAVGYGVAPADTTRTKWIAQQTLELRGGDGPALLDLTGKLQEQGFVTESIEWQMSPPLRRKSYLAATSVALRALYEQAAAAAATLGLRFDHYATIQLQPRELRPGRPMMALAAKSSGPSPQTTAAPEDVTADVSAEVLLRPAP